jgi:hypothetical protein
VTRSANGMVRGPGEASSLRRKQPPLPSMQQPSARTMRSGFSSTKHFACSLALTGMEYSITDAQDGWRSYRPLFIVFECRTPLRPG